MKKNIFIFICSAIFFISCASFKNELIKTGGKNEVIQNAILDFCKTTSLYKKDTVFSVDFYESVKNEKVIAVSIGKNNTKLLFNSKNNMDINGKLPSRYLEKDGKLFFWWDKNYSLTEEAINIYRKYNLLQDDEGGWIKFPDSKINEKQKDAHYYFCKNNLTIYKKVITNKGLGYYTPPELNCD